MQSIEGRRDIRGFRKDMIPMELIDQVLAAGIEAPSSKSEQPWRFAVAGGKAKEETFGLFEVGLTWEQSGQALLPENRNVLLDAWNMLKVMKQAPVIIMVLSEESGSSFEAVSNEGRVAEIANMQSIGATIGSTILAAEELGLGAFWICNTFFMYAEFCEWFHADRQLVAVVTPGYLDEAPSPHPRKESQDVVIYRFERCRNPAGKVNNSFSCQNKFNLALEEAESRRWDLTFTVLLNSSLSRT